jgi:hypothetical protein
MRRLIGWWWLGLAVAAMPVEAAPRANDAVEVKRNDALVAFSYGYPAAAARIAPLRRWLDQDRARFAAETRRDAQEDRREATKAGYPFHQHDASRHWSVVTETPRLLSLSGETYRFTGGAHGGTLIDTIVWDKARGRRVNPRAMFVSAAALQDLLGATWCARLKAERTKRLGEDPGVDPVFPCPTIDKLTLLLGSTNRRAIDRIGLIAGQYVAGAYVEGMYEVTLPVTPALLRIVKPEWRGVFAVGGGGAK